MNRSTTAVRSPGALAILPTPSAAATPSALGETDILSALAHEVRGALTTMRVTLDLLHDLDVSESREAPQLMEHLRRSVFWIEGLIENTQWAAMPADPTTPERTPISILDAIEPAISLVTPRLAQKGQELKLRCSTPAPSVNGDAARLSQVVANLMNNASAYSPGGETIEIDVSASEGWVCVRVTDHGPGLRPDEQEKVFDRYVRGSASMRSCTRGFGLGLYLAKSFVESHAGTIGVDSAAGEGASFWFKLPRRWE